MKKRQLLIYMLVGSLVFASTPMTAAAEENVVSEMLAPVSEMTESEAASVMETSAETPAEFSAETTAEAPAEASAEVPAETPAETPTEAPTEAPAETPAETPTETPTETPVESPTETPTEAPTETPTESPTETPAEIPTDDFTAPSEPAASEGEINVIVVPEAVPTLGAATEAAEGETESAYPFYIGEVPYETLADAISAVADSESINDACTQIIIKVSELKFSETIAIPQNKNICLVAGLETVTLSRAEGFTGEFFHVNGGVLNLATGEIVKEDGTDTKSKLVLDGAVLDGTTCESLVYVEAGVFGIGENVELKNNHTEESGSAIYNKAEGSVYLIGGNISGNKTDASGAGIYSEGILYVQGSPVVSGNTDSEGSENNIVLSGTGAGIVVTGAFGDSADLQVQVAEGTEGTKVISILEHAEGVTMEDALAAITYEGEGYVLDENGMLKTEEAEEPDDPGNEEPDERDPILSAVDQSIISGLEDAKYFYPASERNGKYTYYNFSVKGAGTEITDPVAGDIKWEPVYWSYKKSPSDSEKSTKWTIGTESGISSAGTQSIYVFFDKYEYDGSSWQAVNTTKSVKYSYQSLALFYLTGVSCTWRSQTEADVTFRTNKAAKYYVEAVVKNSAQPSPVESNFVDMAADTDLTITVGDLEAGTEYDIYVYAIDKDGGIVSGMKFQPKESTRPSAPTTREPYTPAVTESVVTGLENALQFYPNTFYSFSVKGAGTDNTDPVEGDEKWMPVYWSTSSNPSNSQKHTTWKIGAAAGISQAATYNMYVFYQKYYYNGSKWVATDTIKSVAYQFKSAEIEITVTPDDTNNGSGGYYDEDGNYVPGSGSAEGAGEQLGTTTDTGAATTTGAVNTADNAPVGSLFAMMAAALSAMCCTITRKRKKTNK